MKDQASAVHVTCLESFCGGSAEVRLHLSRFDILQYRYFLFKKTMPNVQIFQRYSSWLQLAWRPFRLSNKFIDQA